MGSTRSSRAADAGARRRRRATGPSPSAGTARQRRAHWEGIYRENPDTDLSWTQGEPRISLGLIQELARPDERVLDVGGGASVLGARLAAAGYARVEVLDVSETALDRGRKLEVAGAPAVARRRADVLAGEELGPAAVWHDRAVFHFLTRADDRRRYVAAAATAVPVGGHAVIATFASDGPPRCSGLPVRRYDPSDLAREFAPAFRLERTVREDHVTPWGAHQPFTYVVLVRAPDGGAAKEGVASRRAGRPT